MTTNRKHHIT